MALHRAIPTVLGAIAALVTMALLVLNVVLAQATSNFSLLPVTATAATASALEAGIMLVICWLCVLHVNPGSKSPFGSRSAVWAGALALPLVVSAAISAATIVLLHDASETLPADALGPIDTAAFMVACSAVLSATVALQLAFVLLHLVLVRRHGASDESAADGSTTGGRRSTMTHVKSIRYSKTSPAPSQVRKGSRSPPASIGGRSMAERTHSVRSTAETTHSVRSTAETTHSVRSTAETMHSVRSTLPHAINAATSNMCSGRSSRRPPSLDSTAWRDRASAGSEAYESWDTSASSSAPPPVPQSTGTTSAKFGCFLETIPASPNISRFPSPGSLALDVEPPPPRRPVARSRSNSAMSDRVRMSPAATHHSTARESHIHPLFRSDSPTPPPAVKPGTVVTAAPNAGQLIASDDARSIRCMRSCSALLPQASSPLREQGSFEAEHDKEKKHGKEEEEEEEDEEDAEHDKTTQPAIPSWIMTAGKRLSLCDYNARRASSMRESSMRETIGDAEEVVAAAELP